MAERQRSCALCSNKTSTMHMLPKNPDLRIKWLQFIFREIPQQYNSKLTICSSHFEESDFINFGEFSRGFTTKLLLKPGAIPSQHSTISAQPDFSPNLLVCSAHFTSESFTNLGEYNDGFAKKLLIKDTAVPTLSGATSAPQPRTTDGACGISPAVKHVACQTDPPETKYANTELFLRKNPERKSVATQLSMRTMQNPFRSKATQVQVSSRDFGVCTLTFPLDSPLLFLQPTIFKRPPKRPRLSLTDEEEGPSES